MSEITTAITADVSPSQKLLVVDLGKKHSKRKIRKLRKGTGPLVRKIADMIGQLQEEGMTAGDVQPIVVVVQAKKRKSKFGF